MSITSLEPEFIVDPIGKIHQGVLLISGNVVHGIASTAPRGTTRIRLKNKMLLPGFINVHSHALQRALRGRVEQRSPEGLDDFWSWRTNMYKDAHRATLDDIEAIATLAYFEMLKSGFVAVGEFNYLHHQPSGIPYADPTSISQRLMKAAENVGIRQTLITCAYQRKNYRESLVAEQKRFAFRNSSEFLEHAQNVRDQVQSQLLNHAVAIHSTRACSERFIREVCQSDLAALGPLHVHASEQTKEVEEAFEEYGCSPIEALKQFGALHENTTLIHATHLSPTDSALVAKSKARVGLCPSTERNLGDGLCTIASLLELGIPICIGTDQHVRLDPVNELREIEEQERLRLKKRCIIAQQGKSIAESLIPIGTLNGRKSLGLSAGVDWALEPADLVAVTLPFSYEVTGPINALNEWIVSGTHHDVTDVFVNGTQLVCDKIARINQNDVLQNANAALKRLLSNH